MGVNDLNRLSVGCKVWGVGVKTFSIRTIVTVIYVFKPHGGSLASKPVNKSVLIVLLYLTIDVDRVLKSTKNGNKLDEILGCLQNTIDRTTVLRVGATARHRASIYYLIHARYF